jgi:hypothetical protein
MVIDAEVAAFWSATFAASILVWPEAGCIEIVSDPKPDGTTANTNRKGGEIVKRDW